jgi:hypothetical protein
VIVMAATIPVEEESGTFSGRRHAHNGYYAGDAVAFGRDPLQTVVHPSTPVDVHGQLRSR